MLAAALVIDIVGSTSRRAELGEAAANARDLAERAQMAEAVRSRGGEVVDFTGDGAIALLPSSSAGLAAALALCGPHYRIGLAVGEVHQLDGTWSGAPLVAAAWLEQRCPPGAVACSALAMRTATTALASVAEPLPGTPPGSIQPDAVVLRPAD